MSFTYKGQLFETTWAVHQVRRGWKLSPERCDWSVSYIPEPTTDPETGDVYFYDDPWPLVRDCGAERVESWRGWACAAGHEHTAADVRASEGWDYAEDAYDAAVITRGGREARPMGPNTFIDPGEVAQIATTL